MIRLKRGRAVIPHGPNVALGDWGFGGLLREVFVHSNYKLVQKQKVPTYKKNPRRNGGFNSLIINN